MNKFLDTVSNKIEDFESIQSLVDKIRFAQSPEEENRIVKTYLAKVRTLFRHNKLTLNARLMRKLIFIHTIGYDCGFAAMECLTLIASNDIASKHIAYITISMILDSQNEASILLCNSLLNDCSHKYQYTVGMALNCLGINNF